MLTAVVQQQKMKPTKLQSFFAKEWPYRLVWSVIFMAVVVPILIVMFPVAFMDWKIFLAFVAVLLLSPVLAFFTANLLMLCLFSPIYMARGDYNGAPFDVGDLVQILDGPHKGKIVRVYSKWQGNSVRVELGEKEKETFVDVFCPHKLLKEKTAEQTSVGDVANRAAPAK